MKQATTHGDGDTKVDLTSATSLTTDIYCADCGERLGGAAREAALIEALKGMMYPKFGCSGPGDCRARFPQVHCERCAARAALADPSASAKALLDALAIAEAALRHYSERTYESRTEVDYFIQSAADEALEKIAALRAAEGSGA